MTDLGAYAAGFNSYRRMLAAVDDTARIGIFANAAKEAASFVARGLDKIVAVDQLHDMATTYGLTDVDAVQWIIAREFEKIEEQQRVPDDLGDVDALRQYINGGDQQQSPQLGEWAAGDDPGTIPVREWLLANQFCRQYISSIVAAGGTGKSALRLLQFISLALGKSLCGQFVFRRSRVLLVSLEDDRNELQRRIQAVLLHFQIKRSELEGYLFCASPTQLIKLAEMDPKKRIRHLGILESQLRMSLDAHKRNGGAIDLLSLDPFVKTHALEENDSGDMNYVCDILAKLSVEYNVAVDSPHHVHKGLIEPGNADAGRGSSGIRDAARLVYTLCAMSTEEAERFGIPPDQRRFYVRLDPAKLNIAAPPATATWFKLIGVPIGNGTPEYPSGDTVQVAEPWQPPELWNVSVDVLNRILDEIAKGMDDGRRYSNAPKAADRQVWPIVQKYCPDKSEGPCRTIINTWLTTGLLYPDDYDDPVQRRVRKGLFVNDAKRPV